MPLCLYKIIKKQILLYTDIFWLLPLADIFTIIRSGYEILPTPNYRIFFWWLTITLYVLFFLHVHFWFNKLIKNTLLYNYRFVGFVSIKKTVLSFYSLWDFRTYNYVNDSGSLIFWFWKIFLIFHVQWDQQTYQKIILTINYIIPVP